ncbi:type II toxin-antitoxin system HipA family toxin [Boseaceae bacterium BT-24-1]|nr:type II toxin-antitoxin system HipA family toxin [Boseaceae bacterium BT-24-1]
MNEQESITLRVSLNLEGASLLVGRLRWSRDDRVAAFEYDRDVLASGLAISPFRTKLGPGVIMGARTPFDGLHGVFADSLPDGWGRLLVDRQIARSGGNPSQLTPVDRLAMIGSRGMGALTYAPEMPLPDVNEPADIGWLARQAELILQGQSDEGISHLLQASGGSAGARPKVLALRDSVTGTFQVDDGSVAAEGREHWLIKLKHRSEGSDIGRVEHAYAEMATQAGIDFPATQLILDDRGVAHFAVRRFDRTDAGRIHTHTLAGLVQADFRLPSLDYQDLLKVTAILGRDQFQVEEAFRRMVFNIVTGNRDDHAKNHAFLMGREGRWRLSPAYDVTPSDGPGGEHNMTVAGEGRAPGPAHIAKVAADAGIPNATSHDIVEQVIEAVASWRSQADSAGVGAAETSAIANVIELNTKAALGLKGAVLKERAKGRDTRSSSPGKPTSSTRRKPVPGWER